MVIYRKQLVFSDEGWQELVSYHQEVLNALRGVLTYASTIAHVVQDNLPLNGKGEEQQ